MTTEATHEDEDCVLVPVDVLARVESDLKAAGRDCNATATSLAMAIGLGCGMLREYFAEAQDIRDAKRAK